MSTGNSVCLVDFCGYWSPGHFPVSYWADYDPCTGLVTFGGEWCEVAPVLCETEPTESEVEALENYAWWAIKTEGD